LIPPIKANKNRFFTWFHPDSPLLTVTYLDYPVPWFKILVYNYRRKDGTYRVLYKSKCFFNHVGVNVDVISHFLILSLTRKSGTKRIIIGVKLYDFVGGELIGRFHIPSTAKWIHYKIEIGQS
jgi:hypothetical protein